MSVRLPNGAVFSIASAYSAPKIVSALTNAKPPVAASTAHGLINADVVEVASGWSNIDGRVARVSGSTTDSLSLEGLDTTDTTKFPAGTGTGTVRKVSTWQQISQVLDSTSSGGQQQFYNYSFLEDSGDEKQIPTIRSARSIALTIADDDSLPQYALLAAANEDRLPRAIRFQLPSGSVIYFRAYVAFSEMPTTTKNQAMALTVTLSLTGEPTRYSA
jgi:hypothetical protein